MLQITSLHIADCLRDDTDVARAPNDDLMLPPPLVRHPDVRLAIEDRSYIVFFAGALVSALAGGFLLAILVSLWLGGRVSWPADGASPAQAHGWAQLQGWAGLFVAGMALRLIPRFAGRRPLPASATLAIFALLFSGVVGRTAAQSFAGGSTSGIIMFGANTIAATGSLAVAATLIATVVRGRRRPEPWRYFVLAGAVWWAVWAALLIATGFHASDDAVVPSRMDEAMVWVVMLGAISNFIWAVQSRSVPIFFGRRLPVIRQLIVPGALLNVGAVLVLIALATSGAAEQRTSAAGHAAAGVALIWLPVAAGAVWGSPHRLRPRARGAARYVLLANAASVSAGVFLLISGGVSFIRGEPALVGLQDAARHAIGLGLITALIMGMARLVAPVFAIERNESRGPDIAERASWWAITAAVVLRLGAGALTDAVDTEPRMDLAVLAGACAWLAVVLFAVSVARAVRREPSMREIRTPRADGRRPS